MIKNLKQYLSKFIICWSILGKNNKRLYLDIFDKRARKIIKTKGDFNIWSLNLWNLMLHSENWDVIVDVGSNYGEMLLWADLPKKSRLIAVEPNSHISFFLKKSLEESGINCLISNKAISDFDGVGIFSIDNKWSGTSSLVKFDSNKLKEDLDYRFSKKEVDVTTLTSLVGEISNDKQLLIKIDVEGGEVGALKGALSLLRSVKKYAIMIELIHLRDDEMDWILKNFAVSLFNKKSNSLDLISADSPANLLQSIEKNDYYEQDVILSSK